MGIVGTGHALPETSVENAEVAARLGVDADWILARTGIRARRVLADTESLLDLAEAAARRALDAARLDPGALTRVVVATVTDRLLAARVADRLGLRCAALDVAAASAGFVYALDVASGDGPTLVVGAEQLSRVVDWSDRDTAILFGDGAGAAVLDPSRGARIVATRFGSDGSAHEAVGIVDGVVRMRGRAVYRAYVTHLPAAVSAVAEAAGWTIADIDHLVPHQANGRALEAVARRLALPPGRLVLDLADVGNTSAASIPIALDRAVRSGRVARGDRVVLAALGAGLVWGAAALDWD